MTANETETATSSPEHTVPTLGRRIQGVLTEPVATFRSLDPAWGILGPWLAILAAGLVYAVVAIAQVDHAKLGSERSAYAKTLLSDQMKRMSAGQEDSVDPGKIGAFGARFVLLAGPTVGAIVSIVFVGLVLFAASATLGGKKDLLRSIVVAAHAKLVVLLAYAALFVGLILGNPQPQTSLANVADEVAHPLASAALSFVDPIALWHSVLLAIGLVVALGLSRKRAIGVVAALHAAGWAGTLLLGALSLVGRK